MQNHASLPQIQSILVGSAFVAVVVVTHAARALPTEIIGSVPSASRADVVLLSGTTVERVQNGPQIDVEADEVSAWNHGLENALGEDGWTVVRTNTLEQAPAVASWTRTARGIGQGGVALTFVNNSGSEPVVIRALGDASAGGALQVVQKTTSSKPKAGDVKKVQSIITRFRAMHVFDRQTENDVTRVLQTFLKLTSDVGAAHMRAVAEGLRLISEKLDKQALVAIQANNAALMLLYTL